MSLSVPTLHRLRSSFGGDVIAPEHAEYDTARRVWNARFDHQPAAIARPTTTADVARAIRFARDQDLPLAVRCGGHSPAGQSSCDGGLVIDLSRMGGVSVDPDRRLARAGGGALLSELDAAGQAHGLVCPVGVVGHTGVAGLTLGGGMGRLQRRFGLTIDNLRAVELVTADGRTVRASEADEPELFWALRGAGPNFGVVTAFEFELQPFGPTLHRGFSMYHSRHVHDLWAIYRDYADRAPDSVSSFFIIGRADPPEEYPDEIAGQPIIVVAYNHSGDPGEVERDLAPLRGGPAPAGQTDIAIDYVEVQTANDELMAAGRRSYINGGLADDVRPETLDALVGHMERAPNHECSIGIALLGGAIGRVPADATAFVGRDARFDVSADTSWDDADDDDACLDWSREAMTIAAADMRVGRYGNEVSEAGPEVSRSIYGDDVYRRLAEVKRVWDPDNVFRLNHNIEPAG